MNKRFSYKHKILLCSFILFPLLITSLYAQDRLEKRYSYDFRGDALTEVLGEVAKTTGIDMVYDPKILRGINIYCRIKKQPVPEVLKNVLADTPLDFVILSSGTFVIVRTVRERPAYGSYYGKVVDGESGEALPGATVLLADASGGTSTGSSGTFALNKLVTGTYKIVFSYVGYKPVYKTIDIRPNQNIREEVALQPKPVDFAPVIVSDHRAQIQNGSSGGPLTESDSQWETTGKMQDAIRSLSLFSGVQYGLPMTDLHLQGGQRGDHRILLDGVPVYNPYSFGQMFSAFSPYAINKVELHKAGYGVSEGSQIAGLIDLRHDVNSISGNQALIQVDPLSLNLRGDLYFPRDKENEESSLKVMAAARSNYWDLYQEPTLDRTLQEWDNLDPLITALVIKSETDPSLYEPRSHQTDVRFHDIHLASSYAINDFNTLSSSFYVGENFVNTDLLRQAPQAGNLPEFLYARDQYRWNNFVGQLTFNQLISSRFSLNTQASFSSSRLRYRYQIGTSDDPTIPNLGNRASAEAALADFQAASEVNRVPAQRSANNIQHFILRSDGSYSFNPRFTLDAGVQLDYVETRVNLVNLGDLFYLSTLSDQQSTFLSSYLNGNWTWGNYWNLTLGNRITLANTSGRLYSEPRASIQLDRPGTGIGYWSARISGGLYRQFINQYEITNPGPTSLVPSFTIWSHAGASDTPEAWHLSGSFHLEPAEHTAVNIEWFYKWQPTAYTVSYENLLQGGTIDRSGFGAFAETTELKTLGGGLRLNQSLAESNVQLMAGYDYSFSRINLDTQFGRAVTPPWNEPHRFQLRALTRILPNLAAVAKWQSIYGRSWGYRQSYYNYLLYQDGNATGDFSFMHPEDDRLEPFHQLDLSLIYTPSFPFADMEIRLDLINLLNRRNTIDWSLRPPGFGENETDGQYEIRKRTMPGFNSSISIQIGI